MSTNKSKIKTINIRTVNKLLTKCSTCKFINNLPLPITHEEKYNFSCKCNKLIATVNKCAYCQKKYYYLVNKSHSIWTKLCDRCIEDGVVDCALR
jgi:hypothetical protein